MRYILGFAMLMALLTTPARMNGAEYVVENKVPPFAVVNKAPKVTVRTTCGCAKTRQCTCWESACSCAACDKPGNRPPNPTANYGTTSNGEIVRHYDPDHYCDVCGKYANTVVESDGGIHAHQCDHAGTKFAGQPPLKWWHNDALPAQTYTIPKSFSSDCPNGNCPNASYSRSGFFFRR